MMTKDDITKLPTPEITLIFEKSRFCPSGNKSCWEDYSKLERHARSLEQQRDVLRMALEDCYKELLGAEIYVPTKTWQIHIIRARGNAKATIAAIMELSK